MPGKKKGKKKKSASREQKASSTTYPVIPEDVPPPPRPMERLVKLLTTHPVTEKDLYGIKVSTRALEKLSPSEIQDLRVVFEAMDIHGRGFIGPIEVRRALKALGFKVNREQARQMVHDASCKGKGMIDFNEFLELVIEKQADSKDVYDEILQGFKLLDIEGTGNLSIENLKQASKVTGCKFSKQDILDMMEEADVNGDGFVDKDEFIKIMLQTNLF